MKQCLDIARNFINDEDEEIVNIANQIISAFEKKVNQDTKVLTISFTISLSHSLSHSLIHYFIGHAKCQIYFISKYLSEFYARSFVLP